MVFLEQGGETVRDLIAVALTTGQYGDDSTTESASDTGLISPIASSSQTLSVTKSGLTIETVHELDSVTSNGETLAEFALDTSTQSLTRVTTTPLIKDNTKEVVTTSIIYISIN